ncbi:MAG: hypothetical protein ACHQIG_12550 [Acidimicrobiia bacterium]
METLLTFHKYWGYTAIVANALAGIAALVAWRMRRARGRWIWYATIAAEAALMLQVLVGTILVAAGNYKPVRFHMFYGFVAFLTVGLAYQYRRSMRGRLEMFYGLVGLFLMGLGIRAVMQVT